MGVGEKAAFNSKKTYGYKRRKNDRHRVNPARRNAEEGDGRDGRRGGVGFKPGV